MRPARGQRSVDLVEPLKSEAGEVEVHTTSYGRDKFASVKVPCPRFENPARVRVGGSVTRNLGDFNSVRVEVSVELPCQPTEADIDNASSYASHLVDGYIARELAIALKPQG